MRPINRFGVRTVSVALCIALAASSGQSLWAAVAKQAQVRPPALVPIPALPASLQVRPLGMPQAAAQPAIQPAAAVLSSLSVELQEPGRGAEAPQKTLAEVYGGRAKKFVGAALPVLAAAPFVAMAAGADSPSAALLAVGALPLLGMISNKEKWEEIKKLVDNDSLDPSVRQAIQERARALALLEASVTGLARDGWSLEVMNGLLAVAKAAAAAGEDPQLPLRAAKQRAHWWGDFLAIAKTEHELGIDPLPSIADARERTSRERFDVFIDANIKIGATVDEMGMDPQPDFDRARESILQQSDMQPEVVHDRLRALSRLFRAEIAARKDPRPTIEAFRVIAVVDSPQGIRDEREIARDLAEVAEMEIEAGLDPSATLKAAEEYAAVAARYVAGAPEARIAQVQAKAALALLKKSADILWNAFRIGMPVLAAGLLVLLAPASALAATAAVAAGWGSKSLALLAIGAFGGVLSLKKWAEIDDLALDEGMDKSLREAIKQHAQARRLLEEVRGRLPGHLPAYSDRILPFIAVTEFQGGIDPAETLKAAEKAARASGYAQPRMMTALAMGLAGQDPLPLLQDAKRVIREWRYRVARGADDMILIAQVEALLGRDYRESLNEAMRFIQIAQSSSRNAEDRKSRYAEHGRQIADLARAAIQTDLDPAPALKAAREIASMTDYVLASLRDGSTQTVSQYIDSVAAGQTEVFDLFNRTAMFPEDMGDFSEVRALLRQSRPKLWPFHRIGSAPL